MACPLGLAKKPVIFILREMIVPNMLFLIKKKKKKKHARGLFSVPYISLLLFLSILLATNFYFYFYFLIFHKSCLAFASRFLGTVRSQWPALHGLLSLFFTCGLWLSAHFFIACDEDIRVSIPR